MYERNRMFNCCLALEDSTSFQDVDRIPHRISAEMGDAEGRVRVEIHSLIVSWLVHSLDSPPLCVEAIHRDSYLDADTGLFYVPGLVARKLLLQYHDRERKAEEKRALRQQKKEQEARRAQQPKSPRSRKVQ